MTFAREISRAIRSTLVLWILTAIIYPLVMVAFGQIVFPFQANGSILKDGSGKAIGSALIGQPFSSDRYFNSRPSSTSYSTADPNNDKDGILKTGVSGASNLAPSNPDLIKRVRETTEKLKQAEIQPTADLVYTSGSSLDPHITPEAARSQVSRIAKARQLQPQQLNLLIAQNTDGRSLGIFGEPGINVLRLNLALDALK
ncbi:K(+)-transporting ATPase subunit C [Oscillatoria sp. FACHB-1406]|uniref:K(+)-transporting ATPase subunit C n=1 Tax=Oscillatoria sp. FACHB-1406 TaxID=2692846 RepID=UPI001687E048|nr:K(+)-transporting ATPase subunit C [Oscillatoria sp. FACHB-1406]MBD2577122.1 K(+)-transporting ATPase subunit C [Oscillatoria sp. FACHB-1406]